MRIGLDAKRLYNNFTGLGNYSRSLMRNLQAYYPNNEYYLYTPKLKKTAITKYFYNNPNFKTHLSKSIIKPYWRSFSIAKQLKKDGIEMYHGMSNEIPLNLKKVGIKSIVTIHDLIFNILPETYPFMDRRIYDLKFRRSCLDADKIIAISENTKRDVIEFYGIESDKIEVIYQCCGQIFYDLMDKEECENVLKRYGIPNEYLLFVGSVEKRKNLKIIIKAYEWLHPDLRIPLVVVGRAGNYTKEFLRIIETKKLKDRVIWISDLEDNYYLQAIYQRAMVFIYPSFYEGFGLPVVEALLSKTPVVTTNTSSLPEAGGPQSLYIDPNNAEELANAIDKALTDTKHRNEMIRIGHQYAIERFSPEQVTHQLMNCYRKVIQ